MVSQSSKRKFPDGCLQVLPNLADGKWTFNGTSEIRSGLYAGQAASTYFWPVTEDYGYGRVDASYVFYVNQVSFGCGHMLRGLLLPRFVVFEQAWHFGAAALFLGS